MLNVVSHFAPHVSRKRPAELVAVVIRVGQANNSGITLPSRTIITGRPVLV